MKKIITSILFSIIGILFSNDTTAQNPYLGFYSTNNSFSVVEGNSISLRLTLSGAISTPVIVNVTTSTGTAGSSDFTSINTTVTIPAGQTQSPLFTISTTNDSTVEPNETFRVNTQTVSANTSNVYSQKYITIRDNDTVPTLSITSQVTSREGGYNAYVSFSLSNIYNSDVIVNCTTTPGTANASDFTAVNTNVIIPAGQSYVNTSVIITDDTLVEPDETFTFNGTVTSGNTTNTAVSTTITIIDNDITPTITLSGNGIGEGQTTTAYLQLDRTYNSDIVVTITTSAGTASTSDYTTTSLTQTISANSYGIGVSIPTSEDTIDEPQEIFYVHATVTSGNTTNTNLTSEITIIDNDGLPDLRVFYYGGGDAQPAQGSGIYEGDTITFGISLSQPNSTNTTVQVSTAPGTASNADFTPISTTLTIPAGSYSTSIDVQTTIDNLLEGTENFTFNVTNISGNTFNPTASVVAEILDNYNVHANSDNFTFVAGTGNNLSVIANDFYHGSPAIPSDVTYTIDTNTIGATINNQGILIVPANVEPGYYYLTYTVCEVANPSICDTSSVVLTITTPLDFSYTTNIIDANGDGYTSAGDVLTIAYTFTNNGNAPITNIQPENSFQSNITHFGTIASLAAGASNSTSITGQIIIAQNDINYGATSFTPQFFGTYYSNLIGTGADSSIIINSSDGIRLKTFVDSNNNGIQDGIEPEFKFGNFDYSVNGGIVHNIYCQGTYHIYESNPTSVYNLSYNVDTPWATYNLCPIVYPNVTVPTGSGITTYNFPIATTPYQDLSTYIVNSTLPRPGMVWYNYIVYRNNSNQPVNSATVTFTKDPQVTVTNVSASGATVNANGFTYTFTNLAPFETRYINVELLVPAIPTVALGQLLTNSVAITMPPGDIYPINNSASITDAIVGSYDPNDITEIHGERIVHSTFTSDDYLTYIIRFENTGTAEAINIKIEDVLDSKLDASTIRMIDASAAYSLERIGSNLTWRFNGINLPPSVENTLIGKGYITFQVKPNPGYAIGDIIPNFASIYFDTNPPIITNTFNTEFVNTLNTTSFTKDNVMIYPNPANEFVKVSLNNSNETINSIILTDILGKTISEQRNINSNQTIINLSSLAKGMYLLKITSGTNISLMKKITKQ